MMSTNQNLALHGGAPALPADVSFPEWPTHDENEEKALLEVLASGRWGSTHGNVVATFEREFAAYQQAQHAICCCNGTLAIALALRACGVGIGDEVIVPPYTFIATASAALFVGAIPVFADVDPATHLLDPKAAAAAITERTRAIIPVHLAGRPADMDAFTALGHRQGVAIIEDAAQAHGASYRGRAVGAFGSMGTFSFQTSKNISAGEGGAVVTNDDDLARVLASLVNVGRVPGGDWYQHETIGYNLRLTEFQAAVLRAQLQRHSGQQAIRERNAALLDSLLGDVPDIRLAPSDPSVTAHGRHLYIFRVPELGARGGRDQAVRALVAEGLAGASPGYVPLHRNAALRTAATDLATRLGRRYAPTECPAADEVSTDTVWLPQRYLLGTEEQTRLVASAITKVVESADL